VKKSSGIQVTMTAFAALFSGLGAQLPLPTKRLKWGKSPVWRN